MIPCSEILNIIHMYIYISIFGSLEFTLETLDQTGTRSATIYFTWYYCDFHEHLTPFYTFSRLYSCYFWFHIDKRHFISPRIESLYRITYKAAHTMVIILKGSKILWSTHLRRGNGELRV